MLESTIRDVPDFPKEGILFKDITPLLRDAKALNESLRQMAEAVDPDTYDLICGIESRGFIFGTALAARLDKGFIPMRKPGKLPYKTVSQEYQLEYGTDTLEMHVDAVEAGQKVLVVDDLLATGGTMGAALDLIKRIGGDPVAAMVVIELTFLSGRDKLGGVPCHTLLSY